MVPVHPAQVPTCGFVSFSFLALLVPCAFAWIQNKFIIFACPRFPFRYSVEKSDANLIQMHINNEGDRMMVYKYINPLQGTFPLVLIEGMFCHV